MNPRHDEFPDTRSFAPAAAPRFAAVADAGVDGAPQAPPSPLSERAARAMAVLCRDGIDAGPLARRSPQALDRLAEHWDAPERMLELLSAMFADRCDPAARGPDAAFSALLAVQRHTVRRIVTAAGLPPAPPPPGLSPGTCTRS